MKRKTVIVLLSALLTASCLVAGCGGNDTKETETGKQSTAAQADETEDETSEKTEPEEAPNDESDTAKTDVEKTDEANAEEEKAEDTKAEEEKTEKQEDVIMYTVVNLILREKGNMDAEMLDVLPINTKVKVLKKGKKWYKVKAEGKKGFVFAEYLTENKEEAKEAAALAAEAEAQAAAEAAAQAAAQNAYTAPAPQTNQAPKSNKKTVVSREDYPDCDGSGHGYSEIQYSDGSTEIVEY